MEFRVPLRGPVRVPFKGFLSGLGFGFRVQGFRALADSLLTLRAQLQKRVEGCQAKCANVKAASRRVHRRRGCAEQQGAPEVITS